ncbi:MAG TPA: ABC-F family ATP-binding cassette domain-containing protein [Chloroflexota bacterium]|nr:ABC-F family ATP-binding cassette domain-containing protein [Chloroflexota bacterium]
MLHVQHLQKSFGVAAVLSDVSFVLNDGEHVGLIGPNGAGKSTLLRCLVGDAQPDGGSIVLSPVGERIGYLPQAFAEGDHRTLGQVVADAQADLRAAEAEFGYHPGYARADAVLDGLGLGAIDPSTRAAQLSGGEKTRLGLAVLLLNEPDLLLLDEPTNHLDIDALVWLEAFLASYPHAALLVSHDRAFLDATVSRVLYLDPESHGVRAYRGGYTEFAAAREQERLIQAQTWRRQQEYVDRVQRDISRHKSVARSIETSTTPNQPGIRRLARKKAALAKSRERKLERFLESDERVERPKLHWPINLDFLNFAPPPGGRAALEVQDVSFGYPGAPPLVEHVSFEVRYGQRFALVGPNGSGKTTLLRLVEGRLQPDSGRIRLGKNVRLGVMAQEHETLDPDLSVLATVLRERPMSQQDARAFLPAFLFSGDSVFKPVRACSLGERSRLQLASLVLRGCNLLLLDEPLNHLDVESREHFEAALDAYAGTVIVVAHDRVFLRNFARHVLEVRGGQVTRSGW